jgi:hypothetical protein
MISSVRLSAFALFLVSLAWLSMPAQAFDYPTVERVEFVEACAQEYPDKAHHEMVYKCSCVIDKMAAQVSYDDFVEITTAAKAFSVAGERGNAVRDSSVGKDFNKRYKEMLKSARESCFIR